MIAIEGSCHCRAVTYRAEIDPERVTICHCEDCQAFSGSAFRASVSADREKVQIAGEPTTYVKQAQSGRRRFQQFCGTCGSALFTTGEGEDSKTMGIRWGSIAQRHLLRPTRQIWRQSAAPWVCPFDDVPANATE